MSVSTFKLNPEARIFTPSLNRYYQDGTAATGGIESPLSKRNGTSRRNRRNDTPSDGCIVVVKNLPITVTETAVIDWLSECGAPSSHVSLHIDARTGFRGTVFVRYDTKETALAALNTLGSTRDFAGRRAKIELQRKGRDKTSGGTELELSENEMKQVHDLIERFVLSDDGEALLPQSLSVKMRKYAHSLAEKKGLVHVTTGETSKDEIPSPRASQEGKQVYLSKNRPCPGEGKRRTKERPGASPTSWSIPIQPPNTPAAHNDSLKNEFYKQCLLSTPELRGTRWHSHAVSPQQRFHIELKTGSRTTPYTESPEKRFGRSPFSPSTTRVKPPPGFEDVAHPTTLPPTPQHDLKRIFSPQKDDPPPQNDDLKRLLDMQTSLPFGLAQLSLMGPVTKAGALVAARSIMSRPNKLSDQASPITPSTQAGSPFTYNTAPIS
eukprot:GHVL01008343.1.p1 GENE.GHVL01008343.1~~GHVL01008343.1.p1  ORF type:complete len:437 (+),score=58.78 GHVL01008343.1:98-1408(+)